MNTSPAFLIADRPCSEIVDWAVRRLGNAGLRTQRTFDLRLACSETAPCHCPQPQAACDCRMVVVLLYLDELPPLSLVAQGCERRTCLYLDASPGQPCNPRLESLARQALLAGTIGTIEETLCN
jgi:hypothetical protein